MLRLIPRVREACISVGGDIEEFETVIPRTFYKGLNKLSTTPSFAET